MHSGSIALSVAALALTMVPLASAQQEATVKAPSYVQMPHMKGSLAIQVASITALWHMPASEGKAAQLRVSSSALPEAKTLTGADAEALWASFGARGEEFLFVSHMGGTLAIPRAQIRTAYYAVDTGVPRLRLMYDGDPNGKNIEGAEATALWKEFQR